MSQAGITNIKGGGGGVVSTLTGDSGGAIPPTANNINLFGTTNQITTTGTPASSQIVWSLPTTVIAPGSVTTTTFLTADLGNITAVSGNFVMPSTTATVGQLVQNGTPLLQTYGNENTFLGGDAGNFTLTVGAASANIGIGNSSLTALTTGQSNVAIGYLSGTSMTSGFQNVAIGTSSMLDLTTGNANTAVGYHSMFSGTSAVANTAYGYSALDALLTGTYNCAIGENAGNNYVGAESSNLLLMNAGVASESNVTRIGTQGAGNGQQNECFIAGIVGVTVSNIQSVVINSSTGQLGVSNGSIVSWSDTSGTVNAASNNGYFITNTCTSTLPAAPNEGDIVSYVVDTTNILTITANTGQKIRIGTTISASAGTAANNARGDSINLVYRTTGATWFSVGAPEGTWTVT